MALPDPQSVTISGTATSLPRTGFTNTSGTFASADGAISETVSHQYGKRTRHLIRLDHSKVAADPFTSGINTKYAASVYIVVDQPNVGYTSAELKAVVDGFLAQLAASSGTLITRILGGES